jgi:hypothetical protein
MCFKYYHSTVGNGRPETSHSILTDLFSITLISVGLRIKRGSPYNKLLSLKIYNLYLKIHIRKPLIITSVWVNSIEHLLLASSLYFPPSPDCTSCMINLYCLVFSFISVVSIFMRSLMINSLLSFDHFNFENGFDIISTNNSPLLFKNKVFDSFN